MSDLDTRERAERGAALLDNVRPFWYEAVSVGALDIRSDYRCVLGQLYGLFCIGVDRLFPGHTDLFTDADHHGFSASTSSDADNAWSELTQAWRDLIAERRCRDLDLFNDEDEKVSVSV